jgi:hypothetical protein
MTRAVLGDFDADAIDEYSEDELNLTLFFIGIGLIQFVLLSLFFSILGESQAGKDI